MPPHVRESALHGRGPPLGRLPRGRAPDRLRGRARLRQPAARRPGARSAVGHPQRLPVAPSRRRAAGAAGAARRARGRRAADDRRLGKLRRPAGQLPRHPSERAAPGRAARRGRPRQHAARDRPGHATRTAPRRRDAAALAAVLRRLRLQPGHASPRGADPDTGLRAARRAGLDTALRHRRRDRRSRDAARAAEPHRRAGRPARQARVADALGLGVGARPRRRVRARRVAALGRRHRRLGRRAADAAERRRDRTPVPRLPARPDRLAARCLMKVGFGVPRKVGEPPAWRQTTHGDMLRLGQKAEALGFDSIWVPDHYFFERPPGAFTPFPEAWTLMTALLMGTSRAQVGSMVLAAGFRHPALLAHMAGALQELCGGRLLLGLGAGNQPAEHAAFDIEFERRVGRFDEYLQILTGLLDGQTMTFEGRHYRLREASLLYRFPKVSILIAAGGERMMRLAARYASAFNGAGGGGGEGFRGKLAELRAACRAIGRDPDEVEVTFSATVVVLPDADATRRAIEVIAAKPPAIPPAEVRARYAIGTPDEVAEELLRAGAWGAQHLVLGLGAEPFTLWSEESLELFAREVLPRLKEAS